MIGRRGSDTSLRTRLAIQRRSISILLRYRIRPYVPPGKLQMKKLESNSGSGPGAPVLTFICWHMAVVGSGNRYLRLKDGQGTLFWLYENRGEAKCSAARLMQDCGRGI